MLNTKERKRTERMVPVLEEALENLNAAYNEVLTDLVIHNFGIEHVCDEDLASMQMTEPELKKLRDAIGVLYQRIGKARANLADDGSNPPF